jgi:hypothetical protein
MNAAGFLRLVVCGYVINLVCLDITMRLVDIPCPLPGRDLRLKNPSLVVVLKEAGYPPMIALHAIAQGQTEPPLPPQLGFGKLTRARASQNPRFEVPSSCL